MILNHNAIIVRHCLVVTLEATVLHPCYNISRKVAKNILVGLISHKES
jgi:hypothetical protein